MKLRVGAIQPSFIPWRGYFDFIASVDVFVFLDDVQYTSRDWRNRNKIKTPKGTEWLTVPVSHKKRSQLICDTFVDNSTSWRKKHLGSWTVNYRSAPYFKDVISMLPELDNTDETISQLNIRLVHRICEYLNISTPMLLSTELQPGGVKTDRLINVVNKLGGEKYLSGPSADAYLDKAAFRRHGISLEYKSYDYPDYSQLWGPFEGAVTVLDLIANCGPNSVNFIQSKIPDILVSESS